MGMGQFRGIITVVVFLAVTLIIVGVAVTQTPTLFSSPTGATSPSATATAPNAALAWTVTDAFTISNGDPIQYYQVPDWHWTAWLDLVPNGSRGITVSTFDYWGPFTVNWEDMAWYDEYTNALRSVQLTNKYILVSTLQSYADVNASLDFKLINSRGNLHVFIDWDSATYGSDISAALAGTGLRFSLKQDFSDRVTTINLIDIVTGLFLGSIFGANTLGIDPTISAIITIGLDSAMVYLAFTIVRSIIPFLPGGGD